MRVLANSDIAGRPMAWPRGLWLRKEAEPRGGDGGSDSALPVGVEGRRERARGPRWHEQVKHGGRRERKRGM